MTDRQSHPDAGRHVPPCPTCAGRMEVVYDRQTAMVAVCVDCHSGITVPRSAHDVTPLAGNVEISESSTVRLDLTKCPVCGFRMQLLSQNLDYVSLGCDPCHVSVSLARPVWELLTTRRGDQNRCV